jgi:hypothetical protein
MNTYKIRFADKLEIFVKAEEMVIAASNIVLKKVDGELIAVFPMDKVFSVLDAKSLTDFPE